MAAFQKILRSLFAIDTRALAAFRIGLGVLVLLDVGIRVGDLRVFYTDHGVLPRTVLFEHFARPFQFSLHAASGTVLWQAILFAVHAAAGLALLLGHHTRRAVFVAWLLSVSIHNREPMVLSLGDALLRMLLLWAFFLPLKPSRGGEREAFGPGTAGVLLQMFLMYFVTIMLKMGSWRDGNALYYAFNLDYMSTGLAMHMLNYPGFLKILSYTTYYLEWIAPWLLLSYFFNRSVRGFTAIVLMLFHFSFIFTIKLGLFPLINIVGLVLFLPGPFWDFAERVLMRDGPLRRWSEAVRGSARRAGESGRSVLEAVRKPASKLTAALAVFFLAHMLVWNFGLLFPGFRSPLHSWPITDLLRLDQKWTMYVPEPSTFDGWFVVVGKLRDGREVDLFRGGKPVDWRKPKSVSSMFKNYRWRKHMTKLAMRSTKKAYIRSYANYLCREWNAERIDIYFNIERTKPDYAPPQIHRKRLLWKNC